MSRKTGQKGAQYGNRNAVKHGGYMTLSRGCLDGRTREARILGEIESELSTAIGGDPSPQQILIIKRAAVKALRCARLEAFIVAGDVSESAESDYLKWAKELRKDLKVLGMERRARDVEDLEEWIRANTA